MTSGLVSTAITQGGAHTLDIAFAYFLARAAIQTPRDLRLFLVMIAPGIALMSLFVVQEAVTHTRVLQRVASDISGSPYRLRDDVRLGLMRGTGPFPHPILAGIFLASFLPLYLASGLRGWPKILGIAASFGGFFSMSSAALLGLLMGGVLWCYDWASEKISNVTWRIFLFGTAILYAMVELTSNSGFYGLMIRYASLNTTSAYNRVLIWNYGTQNIAEHPWFGLGYADWDRPSWMHSGSFDHFWLIMALRFGIPVSILLIAATVAGVILLAVKSRTYRPQDARLLRGVAISLAVFALGAISVSLWLSVLVWFFVLLGIAVSLGVNLQREVPRMLIRRSAARPAPAPAKPHASERLPR
ncbi:O-antigen ligase family protein [Qipengyuania sp. ASV99]|uniref:O-antigen ligase family protein n=1 Tax=Qipengyuania sp. ASV99 TaxID=3399681 RepID=UPI003A4C6D41